MIVLFWVFAAIGAIATVAFLVGLAGVLIGCACDAAATADRRRDRLLLTEWEKNAICGAIGTCRQAAEDARSDGPDFDGMEYDQAATTLEAILARSR